MTHFEIAFGRLLKSLVHRRTLFYLYINPQNRCSWMHWRWVSTLQSKKWKQPQGLAEMQGHDICSMVTVIACMCKKTAHQLMLKTISINITVILRTILQLSFEVSQARNSGLTKRPSVLYTKSFKPWIGMGPSRPSPSIWSQVASSVLELIPISHGPVLNQGEEK